MAVAVETKKTIRQYGIRPPFSEAAPTAKDTMQDLELRRTLNSLGVFESAPHRAKRDKVLSTLKERVRLWSIKLAIEKNLPAKPSTLSFESESSASPVDDLEGSSNKEDLHVGDVAPQDRHIFESHGVYAATLLTFGSYHLQVLFDFDI